jgi:hypothetical protein
MRWPRHTGFWRCVEGLLRLVRVCQVVRRDLQQNWRSRPRLSLELLNCGNSAVLTLRLCRISVPFCQEKPPVAVLASSVTAQSCMYTHTFQVYNLAFIESFVKNIPAVLLPFPLALVKLRQRAWLDGHKTSLLSAPMVKD